MDAGRQILKLRQQLEQARAAMTLDDYQTLAMRTAGEHSQRDALLNAALGACGEAGELADHVKKHAFQGHDIDPDYLVKEAGDVLWYLALIAHTLGMSLSEVAARNVAKLQRRYPDGFSVEASREREDVPDYDGARMEPGPGFPVAYVSRRSTTHDGHLWATYLDADGKLTRRIGQRCSCTRRAPMPLPDDRTMCLDCRRVHDSEVADNG